MRPSLLWNFSILLITGNVLALLMCGTRDYRSCDKYSSKESARVYDCLKRLKPSYKKCNVSDTLCTSTKFTFLDNFVFKQQGCDSEERACKFTEQMKNDISLLTNRSIFVSSVNCTSCNMSGCGSIEELGDNFGCYYVDQSACITDFNSILQSQTISMAQNQTYSCFLDSNPIMCVKQPGLENLCLSKTFKFDDGEVLVLKNCVFKRDKCEWTNEKVIMRNLIGRNVASSECNYCQTDFCNNETVSIKPATLCYYSVLSECYQTETQDGLVNRKQNDTYDCLKTAKRIERHCEEGCLTTSILVEDNVTLVVHMCYYSDMSCQLAENGATLASRIGRRIIKYTCQNCSTNLCNNATTIVPIGDNADVQEPLKCYHSDLRRCVSTVNFVADFDAILRCLAEEMNKNLQTRICAKGLKCTTIVFAMQNYGKVVEYATCGSGPKEKCEKDAHEMNFERFIGQPITHIDCRYCEIDYCNKVTIQQEGSRPLNSKGEILCHVNQFGTCGGSEIPKKNQWNEERKHIQEKVFQCLKTSSVVIEKCQICLTVKYRFFNEDELVLKLCEGNEAKNSFDINGSKSCDLKKNKNWFWEFTGKTLVSIKCNPCDTALCNGQKKSLKKALTVSIARKVMPDVAVFVLTTILFF